jgi:16S rRNA (uracil1498-N3)-methyltransferase
MHRFYAPVENFADARLTLESDEARHLRDVLRLNVGDEVFVFDGKGREYRCTILEIEKKSAKLTINEEIDPVSSESGFEITLAATVLNGEKYDLVIQKAVELGVTKLIPLHALRCDVKVNDASKRLTRWRRIALEATKQSGRAKIMFVTEPVAFQELIVGAEGEEVVMFSEREGEDFSKLKPPKNLTILIGPKGGWDNAELETARTNGVHVVTLGGRILRAETAAIAITAILQHRFGDLN